VSAEAPHNACAVDGSRNSERACGAIEQFCRRGYVVVQAEGLAEQDDSDSGGKLMQRILVATDFSEPSLAAVRYGLELADAVDAGILLLHVIEGSPHCTYTVGGPPAYFKDYVDPDGGLLRTPFGQRIIRRDLCEEAQWKLMTLFPPRYQDRVRPLVTVGNAAEEISRVSKAQNVDLIIMGTRGRGGLRRLFRRPVAAKVSWKVHIPVLTLDTQRHRRSAGGHRGAAYAHVAGGPIGLSRDQPMHGLTTMSPPEDADYGAEHPVPPQRASLKEQSEQHATKRSRAVGV
jgi:nucleotide-binding universal stress UspA family protein